MIYRFATLDPRPTPAAREANDKVLNAGPVLGIEVTVPGLAARCTLGNLDPQHSGGDAGTAAIEAALTCPLPPAGATLATVRPDGDSVGAMAVLLLRQSGYRLLPGAVEKVRLIADVDKEASGPWPGPRPMPTAEDLVGPATPVMHLAADRTRDLRERVALVADWISGDDIANNVLEDYRGRALQEAQDALDGLVVETLRWSEMVIVTGSHRLAPAIGYRYAPIVICSDPQFRFQGGQPHVKHSICRWNTSTYPEMTWDKMVEQLDKEDRAVGDGARWGGSSSFVGSPMGVSSGLSTRDLAAFVRTATMGL